MGCGVPVPGTIIACTAVNPIDAVTAVVSDDITPMTSAASAVRIATTIDLVTERVEFRINAPSLGSRGILPARAVRHAGIGQTVTDDKFGSVRHVFTPNIQPAHMVPPMGFDQEPALGASVCGLPAASLTHMARVT